MNPSIRYIYAYCRYDCESGNRPWNFLSQKQIQEIDEEIARTAFQETDSQEEVARVIYFGSPNAQAIADHKLRCRYVAEVLMAIALSPKPIIF